MNECMCVCMFCQMVMHVKKFSVSSWHQTVWWFCHHHKNIYTHTPKQPWVRATYFNLLQKSLDSFFLIIINFRFKFSLMFLYFFKYVLYLKCALPLLFRLIESHHQSPDHSLHCAPRWELPQDRGAFPHITETFIVIWIQFIVSIEVFLEFLATCSKLREKFRHWMLLK